MKIMNIENRHQQMKMSTCYYEIDRKLNANRVMKCDVPHLVKSRGNSRLRRDLVNNCYIELVPYLFWRRRYADFLLPLPLRRPRFIIDPRFYDQIRSDPRR
jgi:hypothetical protein